MYLSTSTEYFPEMYLSTFQVLYKLYLSTNVLKYKVLLPGSEVDWEIGWVTQRQEGADKAQSLLLGRHRRHQQKNNVKYLKARTTSSGKENRHLSQASLLNLIRSSMLLSLPGMLSSSAQSSYDPEDSDFCAQCWHTRLEPAVLACPEVLRLCHAHEYGLLSHRLMIFSLFSSSVASTSI